MIDFCCVYACGRNSRVNEDLTYYSLPQGKERRELWLPAAGRDDLPDEAQPGSIKFCSLHFSPAQVGKGIIPKGIPSLYLPGFVTYDDHNLEAEKHNVICNSCSDDIVGFRYRCIICPDFDLCQKCEMLEVHPNHLVIRISRSNKFTQADNIITKWRDQLKAEGTKEANDNDNDYQNENAYNTIICKRGERLIKTVKKRIAQKDACRKRFTEIKKTSKKIKSEECNNIEETSVNQYLKSQAQDLAVTHNGDIKLDKIIKRETISPSPYLQNPDLNLKGQEAACNDVDNMLEIIIKREPCDS